jgi:hypothetical protein
MVGHGHHSPSSFFSPSGGHPNLGQQGCDLTSSVGCALRYPCHPSLHPPRSRRQPCSTSDTSVLAMLVATTTWARRSVPSALVHPRARQPAERINIVSGPRPNVQMRSSITHLLEHLIKHLRAPPDSVMFPPCQTTPRISATCSELYTPSREHIRRPSGQS